MNFIDKINYDPKYSKKISAVVIWFVCLIGSSSYLWMMTNPLNKDVDVCVYILNTPFTILAGLVLLGCIIMPIALFGEWFNGLFDD